MDFIIIALVACFASLLTFFSGFGLGTILTPVMVLFFPVEIAIALTGIVHFLNNCFKILLVRKHINWSVGWRFGMPAIIGSFIGAMLLLKLSKFQGLIYSYEFKDRVCEITWVKLIIAFLMLIFVLFEIIPKFQKLQFDKKHLPIGGLISGFFGGLSGNQGALRSMFLIRSGLGKEVYIATGILIACFIDVTRLGVYFNRMKNLEIVDNSKMLMVAVVSAFIGAFLGSKLLKKITFTLVQILVSIMIAILAIGLGFGIL